MKCYPQVYVMNSIEAAKIYCKAFGAEITLEMKNSSGTADAVKNAFEILSNGGVVIEEIHEYPWSSCGATVIDKYGVCWWISI